MRTTLCIQARIGQPQPIYRPPVEQMLVHDLLHIPRIDKPIPNRIRIHHQGRSVLALVQARGLIHPDFSLQSSLFNRLFKGRLQLRTA